MAELDYSQVWDFDPAWTAHEACAATEKACAAGAPFAYPHLPFARWDGYHQVEQLRKSYETGERFALMNALRICARCALPMPDWVARAYIRGYDAVVNARSKSWDEAFGEPYPKGTHLNALRKRRKFQFAVWNRVMEAKHRGVPTDEALFEQIGEEFGIKKTLAQEYFASVKAFWKRFGGDKG